MILPAIPHFDTKLVDDGGTITGEYWRRWIFLLWNAVSKIWTNPVAPSFTFATLPSPATVGMYAVVTNSSTVVWGAIIAAASPGSKVLAFYNGTNWTVLGK